LKINIAEQIQERLSLGQPVKLLIHNKLCPGDCLVMTAAIESLHRQYPEKFITGVDTFCRAIFWHNPRITKFDTNDEVINFISNFGISRNKQPPYHFMEGYVRWFQERLGIKLDLVVNRPSIYLSKRERKKEPQVEGKYWIVNAGYKTNYTAKKWRHSYFQEVVDYFRGKIQFVQIGGKRKKHIHKPLRGAINLVGKTSLRQLMLLCYNAQGGLGPVTCIQHMFAAYQKPYVVLHGARESVHWTAYHTQKVLSNVGTLECCQKQACWKAQVIGGKGKEKCELPVLDDDPTAQCMYNIKPEQVISAIEDWYKGGTLTY